MPRASSVTSVIAMALLSLLSVGPARTTNAQEATPLPEERGFVGSWRLTVSEDQAPAFLALATFGAEGTLVVSPPPVVPPAPRGPQTLVHTSAAHGAWQGTGPDTAILTFVLLAADAEGNVFATRTVRARITLGADGQTLSGTYVGTVADLVGTVLVTDAGTLLATRIVAEAPAIPAATPVVGTPTG